MEVNALECATILVGLTLLPDPPPSVQRCVDGLISKFEAIAESLPEIPE